MTVYTRGRHVIAPLWVTILLAPFWLVFFVFAALWLTLVWSVRALVWAVGVLLRGCASLRSPRGVDSDGEGSQV